MRIVPCRIALPLLLLVALGCREELPPPTELTVLATSSLEEFAQEAARAFESRYNVVVEVRSGGTHELVADLEVKPEGDVLLVAGLEWPDRLQERGLIVADSRWDAVENRLVVLGREEAGYPSVRFVNMVTLGFQSLVVADPVADPAGQYARRWLESVSHRGDSIWRQVQDRLVVVNNIGEVHRAVASDVRTLGVVFVTDIADVPTGKVLFRSPDLGIRYAFALVERPGRPAEAREFLDFLKGPVGIDLLQMNGFLVEDSAIGESADPLTD